MTGCINTSRPAPDSVFDNCRLSAEQHGLEHEVLLPEQVSGRFPGYRLPPGFKVGQTPAPKPPPHLLSLSRLLPERPHINVGLWQP